MDPTVLSVLLGAVIGLILALTGAGGGILAVPLLVFVLHLPVQQAGPVSLLAVGLAAALGAVLGLRRGIVRYRAALVIGVAGMCLAPLGVMLVHYLPNRPLLAAFAVLLAYSSWRVVARDKTGSPRESVPCLVSDADRRLRWTWRCATALTGTGMASGLLSGLFGVGGGFVIVPALSRYSDLDIRSIQATSLAVIALVSLSGVSASAWRGALPWDLAWPFGAGAVVALFAGRSLANRLDARLLKLAFAWFGLLVAIMLLVRALGWQLP